MPRRANQRSGQRLPSPAPPLLAPQTRPSCPQWSPGSSHPPSVLFAKNEQRVTINRHDPFSLLACFCCFSRISSIELSRAPHVILYIQDSGTHKNSWAFAGPQGYPANAQLCRGLLSYPHLISLLDGGKRVIPPQNTPAGKQGIYFNERTKQPRAVQR
jgi:hypothetical protein